MVCGEQELRQQLWLLVVALEVLQEPLKSIKLSQNQTLLTTKDKFFTMIQIKNLNYSATSAGTWATGGNLNTARYQLGGAGTQTAALGLEVTPVPGSCH